jgi:hypothetical protein
MGVSPELLSERETHNHSKGKCVFIEIVEEEAVEVDYLEMR